MPDCAPKDLYDLLVPRIGIFKKAYGTVRVLPLSTQYPSH
jgi:hypothetical protein